jgi:hypothetical protein
MLLITGKKDLRVRARIMIVTREKKKERRKKKRKKGGGGIERKKMSRCIRSENRSFCALKKTRGINKMLNKILVKQNK